jgi:hypothetical protein
MPNIW